MAKISFLRRHRIARNHSTLLSTLIWVLLLANLVALMVLYSSGSNNSTSVPSKQDKSLLSSVHTHHRVLQKDSSTSSTTSTPTSLQGIRLLVAIAAYDFSQLPHLEEVLDGYHDICVAGAAQVKVVLHTTVAFPVALLDLLQSRMVCPHFSLDIVLKLPRIKLHLVDCHRPLFYQHLEDYDVFIYTEDDIRVTPRTLQTYLDHTHRIETMLKYNNPTANNSNNTRTFKPSDFNVGLVRYEYNFPSHVVMDDTTRHATENVTRVYWEHSSFEPPYIPNVLDLVPPDRAPPMIAQQYVHMKNHHQGMYMATQSLLKAWRDREGCRFNVASNRPGRPKKQSQPLFGTQRVWMSSYQLYGRNKYACGVQQVIPLSDFGALTVHHLPNKNYRRVGNYRNRDLTKDHSVSVSDNALLTALQLHLAMTLAFPPNPYPHHTEHDNNDMRIQMYVDETNPPRGKVEPPPQWKPRLEAFQAYIERGGVLSEQDRQQTSLY